MMKRALLAVAVAMIAITSCGGSGKKVVGNFCYDDAPGGRSAWWVLYDDGSSSQMKNPGISGIPVFC